MHIISVLNPSDENHLNATQSSYCNKDTPAKLAYLVASNPAKTVTNFDDDIEVVLSRPFIFINLDVTECAK